MASLPNDREDRQSSCVACREPIHLGANTCPHCGSSQVPHKWQIVSQTLKWIGGIVTIISLVGGVITLGRYYQDWQERQHTVAEIVAAADWLIRTENYQQAWRMYNQAAEINPSSTIVQNGRFRLSLQWVRSFHVEQAQLSETLDAITEILYRGVATADPDQTATILAHVGYIQAIRKLSRLPVFSDVEALFRQALLSSPDNPYANAMYARWLLLERPMTDELLGRAEELFTRALNAAQGREFVRNLQFSAFKPYSYGYDDEIERRALRVLLTASIAMMDNGEGLPSQDSRSKILDGYGRMGKAEHVEALLGTLPLEAHLKVYEWLLAADDDSREIMIEQSIYIRARLNEQLGNRDRALEYYQSLLATETREEIADLVDQGIKRLTGKLPARALARNYADDQVDTEHLFQFHLDSFAHFDPAEHSRNFDEALVYFNTLSTQDPASLQTLRMKLPAFINRVRDVVRDGDEIEKRNLYTSGFGSWEHNNARRSWAELASLHARLLMIDDQYEQALAQLADVSRTINALDPSAHLDHDWRPMQARLDYELAAVYGRLADDNGSASDREQAMQLLISAVEKGITESGLVSWAEIKGERFAVLSQDPRYQNLVRGR